MKIGQTQFQKIQFLNTISSYVSFYKKMNKNNIPKDVVFQIAQFELKYQILKLQDFNDLFLIEQATLIGNSILKITSNEKN